MAFESPLESSDWKTNALYLGTYLQLSGGEKQRVALARAFLKASPLL